MVKGLLLSVVLILTVCLVAGCGIKTHVDNDKTINTNINQEFIIALDSNPTTGYNWEESHDASRLRLDEERYNADEKAPGLVGAGGTQYFRFRVLKTGTTWITVTYKRPWETGFAEQKVFKVDIK